MAHIGTHLEGCESVHRECKIFKLQEALVEATRLLTTLRDSLAVQVRSDTLAQEIDAWLEQWRTP